MKCGRDAGGLGRSPGKVLLVTMKEMAASRASIFRRLKIIWELTPSAISISIQTLDQPK